MARVPPKIGLLDHIGGGNLGDDATQTAVLEQIRSRWPGSEIYGFTMNPSDTHARHGIPAYPIRRHIWDSRSSGAATAPALKSSVKTAAGRYPALFAVLKLFHALAIRLPGDFACELRLLAKSFHILRSFDLLIISGGGQLLDTWGGPWAFPYTLFKWTLLARLARVKCYYLNVGAGPIQSPLSKWFLTKALVLADYVSFRDAKSELLLRQLGFKGPATVAADNVYGLALPSRDATASGQQPPVVGLSPMAYCDPRVYYKKDSSSYDSFIRKLAAFGVSLSREYHLQCFSTDTSFDAQAIEDLNTRIRKGSGDACSVSCEPIATTGDLVSRMLLMDYIITCRFHGVIFAHLMNIPVIAIAHHPKVATLMADLGLSDYCLDIDTFDAGLLERTFTHMVNHRDEIKARMREKAECYGRALSRQFDSLFSGAPC